MNQSNIEQLKVFIQKKIGRSVQTIKDLRILHDSIEAVLPNHLGFNTLRRFYGFLEGTNPQLKTLNSLSKFVGFSNFSDFSNFQSKDKEWLDWLELIKMELSDNIHPDSFEWLKLQSNKDGYHLMLATLVKAFVYKKNYPALQQFFNQDIFVLTEFDHLKFASHMALFFRRMPKNEIEIIVQTLTPHIRFRENLLHWFMDYSYMNGYFGDMIRQSKLHADPDSHESLFYDLMLNLNKFLTGNKDLEFISIDRILEDYYSVLIGRTYSYNLLYYHQLGNIEKYEEIWLKTLNQMKQFDYSHAFSIELVHALMLLKDFEKLEYVIRNFYEDILVMTNWTQFFNNYLILIADIVLLLRQGKETEAFRQFELIDPNKMSLELDDYNLIYYHLVNFHLLKKNGQNESSKLSEIEYLKIAEKTKFRFFTLLFLEDFLV